LNKTVSSLLIPIVWLPLNGPLNENIDFNGEIEEWISALLNIRDLLVSPSFVINNSLDEGDEESKWDDPNVIVLHGNTDNPQ
jgi:hypothetical protein